MKKQEKGQILTEAVVAMSIMIVGVIGVFGFVTKAISQGRFIADQTAAVNLAAEGVEVTKNILDANALKPFPFDWRLGFNSGFYRADYTSRTLTAVGSHDSAPYLSFDPNTGFYGYNAGRPTTFKRSIQIETVPDGRGEIIEVKVISRVTWKGQNNRLNDVSIATNMFNWR